MVYEKCKSSQQHCHNYRVRLSIIVRAKTPPLVTVWISAHLLPQVLRSYLKTPVGQQPAHAFPPLLIDLRLNSQRLQTNYP